MNIARNILPILCCALLGMTACDGEQKAAPVHKTLALATMTVGTSSAAAEQVLDGSLEAVNQATVSAQTAGRITALPVDVNAQVRAGEVVARLRDIEPRARLAQADASLNAAQARMREADKSFQRIQEVYQKRLVAAAQMDQATAEHDSARAQLLAAQAARNQAAEQLDYAVVRAPYSGVVTERRVQVGEAVLPGQPLLTIQGSGELRAVVDVSQQLADAIRRHSHARVIIADDTTTLGASVIVFPNADPATHTFRVRVNLPPAAAAASHAGQLVKVAFTVGESSGLAVPAACLVWRGEVAGVYVLNGASLEFRAVRPGHQLADGSVEILAGLSVGDKVVIDPAHATALINGAAP